MNLEHCTNFICRWEGFRDHIYSDSVGIPTFGYGSLHRNYPNELFPISKARARQILMLDVQNIYYPAVKRFIKVVLTDNQETALTSFVYNLGGGALQRSTLRKVVNRGDNPQKEFLKWCKAGGIIIKGLLLRRQAEAELFIGG